MDKTCKFLKVEPALLSCEDGFIYPGDRELCLKKDRELLLGISECEDCKFYEAGAPHGSSCYTLFYDTKPEENDLC